MSYIFLQEQGEESSAECFSDIPPSALLKSRTILGESYFNDSETEYSRNSQFGTMSAPSMESLGGDQLMLFAEASPAKTSVQQVKAEEFPEHVRAYGKNMRELLEKYGLKLYSRKTLHCFELGDLELSSKIWPAWGIMQDGVCWELGTSVRHIEETECGFWLTPKASDIGKGENQETFLKRMGNRSNRCAQSLPAQVRMPHTWPIGTLTPQIWPTPLARDTIADCPAERRRQTPHLETEIKIRQNIPLEQKARLNPSWVEWLMGWPIGFTELKPLATDKFRNVQNWHLEFSPPNKVKKMTPQNRIILDIETAPCADGINKFRKPFPNFSESSVAVGNLKDQDKIAAKIEAAKAKHIQAAKDAEADFVDNAALSATTGRVIAVGIRTIANESRIIEGKEEDILAQTWDYFDSAMRSFFQVVGFNIKGFDVPFMMRRSWLLGVPVPRLLEKDRYFHNSLVDLRDIWACGEFPKRGSLDTVARFFGVGAKDSPEVTGATFHKFFLSDDVEKKKLARAYLINDLEITSRVADRLLGEVKTETMSFAEGAA